MTNKRKTLITTLLLTPAVLGTVVLTNPNTINNAIKSYSSKAFAAEIKQEGDIGTYKWSLDSDGVLTLSNPNNSTTQLPLYNTASQLPWYSVRGNIKSIKTKGSIIMNTSSSVLFSELTNLESIDLSGMAIVKGQVLNMSYFLNNSGMNVKNSNMVVDLTQIQNIDTVNTFGNCTYFSQGVHAKQIIFPKGKEITSAQGMFNNANIVSNNFKDLKPLSNANFSAFLYGYKGDIDLTGITMQGSLGNTFNNYQGKITLPNFTNLNNLTGTFQGLNYENITNPDVITNLDVSNVNSLYNTFRDSYNFPANTFTNWNTSKVTSFTSTFNGFQKNSTSNNEAPDVSKWNTSAAVTLSGMFSGAITDKAVDVSNFKTSNVTDISSFQSDYQIGDIGKTPVDTISDVSKWDVSKVFRMDSAFETSKATSGGNLVKSPDFSNWNTSSLTNASRMFAGKTFTNEMHVDNWNTSSLTNASYMFSTRTYSQNSSIYPIQQQAFAISVPYTYKPKVEKWNVSSLTSADYMFSGTFPKESIAINLSDWKLDNLTSARGMFAAYDTSKSIYAPVMTGWKMPKVTDASYMFYGNSNLSTLGLKFDSLINATGMFFSASGKISNNNALDVTSLSFKNLKTANNMFAWVPYNIKGLTGKGSYNIEDASSMFYSAGLGTTTTIDLSNINFAKVTNINNMFNYSGFQTINLSNTSFPVLTSAFNVFNATDKTNEIIGMSLNDSSTSFNSSNKTSLSSSFNGSGIKTLVFGKNASNVVIPDYISINNNNLEYLDISNITTTTSTKIASVNSSLFEIVLGENNKSSNYSSFVNDNSNSNPSLYTNTDKVKQWMYNDKPGEDNYNGIYYKNLVAQINSGNLIPGHYVLNDDKSSITKSDGYAVPSNLTDFTNILNKSVVVTDTSGKEVPATLKNISGKATPGSESQYITAVAYHEDPEMSGRKLELNLAIPVWRMKVLGTDGLTNLSLLTPVYSNFNSGTAGVSYASKMEFGTHDAPDTSSKNVTYPAETRSEEGNTNFVQMYNPNNEENDVTLKATYGKLTNKNTNATIDSAKLRFINSLLTFTDVSSATPKAAVTNGKYQVMPLDGIQYTLIDNKKEYTDSEYYDTIKNYNIASYSYGGLELVIDKGTNVKPGDYTSTITYSVESAP